MKPLDRSDIKSIKHKQYSSEYPKKLETSISIGHIKDLILQEMILNNWIKDDEEITNFVFGRIGVMWEKAASLNGYLNLEIPLTITLNKAEIKFRTYE